MGCEGYSAVAEVYDLLNEELDYEAWADFIEAAFCRFATSRPELVLDLACGTGRMTRTLAKRGYDMIGVDGSWEMLSHAVNASRDARILYLCQDMRSFELYGTVGAVVCCLDSMNYLLTKEDLSACLKTVHNYLDPDGLFLFDMNTPYRFATVYGDRAYLLEAKERGRTVLCAWQNHYSPRTRLCNFDLSVFREESDGRYTRADERQQERCYSLRQVQAALKSANFEFLGVFGGYDFSQPAPDCERWYFAARAKK